MRAALSGTMLLFVRSEGLGRFRSDCGRSPYRLSLSLMGVETGRFCGTGLRSAADPSCLPLRIAYSTLIFGAAVDRQSFVVPPSLDFGLYLARVTPKSRS